MARRLKQSGYWQLSCLVCLIFAVLPARAQESGSQADAKVLPGISIVGNSETPKSLVIVPWRSARISRETKLLPTPLDQKLEPIDKDFFLRQLDFYKLGSPE